MSKEAVNLLSISGKYLILLVFFIFQTNETFANPPNGSLLQILFDLDHTEKNKILGMPAVDERRPDLEHMLKFVTNIRSEKLEQTIKNAGYSHRLFVDQSSTYSLLLPQRNNGIDATIVIDHFPLRDIIIEAPHPSKDLNTDRQAAVLFKKLGARAIIIAGANRCASQTITRCSGKSRVCNREFRNAYRNSDVAHSVHNVFHLAHRALTMRWPNSIVIQLHGFKNPNSDVWFVMSDGSTRIIFDDTSIVGQLRNRIRLLLKNKGRAISCQDAQDMDIKTRRLCATTNVQGRFLNSAKDECYNNAQESSGRFIHIEQVYQKVRQPFAYHLKNIENHQGSNAILKALAYRSFCLDLQRCQIRKSF